VFVHSGRSKNCLVSKWRLALHEPLPPGIDRHRNKYRARRWVNGKRVQRSFATLEEAVAFLSLIEGDVRDGREVEAARTSGVATIMQIVRLWWLGPLIDGEHRGGHRQRVSGVTARGYQYYIAAYISRIGDQSAQSYARNTALLKLFYDSLPNRCAWHVHGVLRMAFRDAVARGLMDRNPCEIEKPAKRRRKRREIPMRDEVEKIVIAASEQDATWALFIYLSATLGTRCGETVALRTEDFDEQRGIVRIERALSKTAGRPTLKEPKSGEARDLPIDDADFWDRVRPFLQDGGFLFRGYYRDAPRTPANAKPWHPDHAEKRFKTMVRGLGLGEYTLHSLRHFVATQLLIEGQPLNQVAEFLGHSPQMTLTLYGRHLDRDAMRKVGRAATGLVVAPVAVTEPEPDEAPPPKAPVPVIAQDVADANVLDLAARGPITNADVQKATGLSRR
jgi:integrase